MMRDLFFAAGGVGLFLLGMLLLTEGLRALAGDALRRWLARFTRTPLSGAATGAAVTAVVQSSSATTVMAVGFVGAGLLSFPQALGVIFGANIGTTLKGWIVAIIGFQFDLGAVAMPLLFVGVLLRMFAGGRWAQAGWALAGFSLLFVGIETMTIGLSAFEGVVTPDDFPPDTLFGRLQLVLIGVAITLVTQSSSAGVATALVALGTGTISFPQAAAMVIGMDMGTTATAVLAALGGSTSARRTGWAHCVYNLLTGAMAFLLLGPYTGFVAPLLTDGGRGDAQLALVAFHTGFNVLGVLLVIPFAGAFARLIVRLVPERGPALTRRLDDQLLKDPGTAVDALGATLGDIANALRRELARALRREGGRAGRERRLGEIAGALEEARRFAASIRTGRDGPDRHGRHQTAIHTLDHLLRLSHRAGQSDRIATLETEPRLARFARLMARGIDAGLGAVPRAVAEGQANRLRRILRDERDRFRDATIDAVTEQAISGQEGLGRLDAVRWLHRVAYHLWRIEHHLRIIAETSPAVREAPPQHAPGAAAA
ncbi:Na/Pi symporter [Limibaculum sp. FT325]|uniref:Na/Pi cotransporter family protein n=1 Tax=Thermohalobaculum sediminis TaxID=2939436 RepID=UPI0020BEDEA8|nr:Na/Pi symporter [Limibaculum sediminis]MCL5777509.1 Na/Pi symporter [Limibaculum sediminis]